MEDNCDSGAETFDFDLHLMHLRKFFYVIRSAGSTLKFAKCQQC